LVGHLFIKKQQRSWMIFNKKVLVCEGTASLSLQSSSMADWVLFAAGRTGHLGRPAGINAS